MSELANLVEPLLQLHGLLRDRVVAAFERSLDDRLTRAVHEGGGDVIYGIDRVAEVAFVDGLTHEIAAVEPIVLVGEGLPDGRMMLPQSASADDAKWRVIIDPIDGT